MKKFFDGGEYFVLTSYRIKTVPISVDNEVSLTLAKTICEDACYLSSSGNGQTAIEIYPKCWEKNWWPYSSFAYAQNP